MANETVTITLQRGDVFQILDGLRARAEAWEVTAEYLATGCCPDGWQVEECSDEGEAQSIAGNYREIIQQIEAQLQPVNSTRTRRGRR